jgi:hypothetical protein
MGNMAPIVLSVGDLWTAAQVDEVAQDIIDLAGTVQTLQYTPGGNNDTPSSVGTSPATWFTMGNITVPTWATKCNVVYAIVGVFAVATGISASAVLKVGSVVGALGSKRILDGGTTGRFSFAVCEKFTGLSTGSQSVTMSASYTAGTVSSYRVDTVSHITARFDFQP